MEFENVAREGRAHVTVKSVAPLPEAVTRYAARIAELQPYQFPQFVWTKGFMQCRWLGVTLSRPRDGVDVG